MKVHSDVDALTDRLRTPADATKTDAKTAFLTVNGKCFDATEQGMDGYADVIPLTIKKMAAPEFRWRRSLARGMFAVAEALSDMLNRVRLNDILRTDELGDISKSARDEAQQAAQGPGGAQNARAQAAVHLLDGPYQEMIGKQQQGKTDAGKSLENFQQQAGDLAALLMAANTRIATLESTISQLQQGSLFNTSPVVSPPVITPPKSHKVEKTPAHPTTPTPPSAGTPLPGGAESRTLPRK